MKLILTKNWSKFLKGDEVEINDQSVLDKGFEIGLFAEPKKVKEVKQKEEK